MWVNDRFFIFEWTFPLSLKSGHALPNGLLRSRLVGATLFMKAGLKAKECLKAVIWKTVFVWICVPLKAAVSLIQEQKWRQSLFDICFQVQMQQSISSKVDLIRPRARSVQWSMQTLSSAHLPGYTFIHLQGDQILSAYVFSHLLTFFCLWKPSQLRGRSITLSSLVYEELNAELPVWQLAAWGIFVKLCIRG